MLSVQFCCEPKTALKKKIIKNLFKNTERFLKKAKQNGHRPGHSLPRHTSKGMGNRVSDARTLVFIAVLFTRAKR